MKIRWKAIFNDMKLNNKNKNNCNNSMNVKRKSNCNINQQENPSRYGIKSNKLSPSQTKDLVAFKV